MLRAPIELFVRKIANDYRPSLRFSVEAITSLHHAADKQSNFLAIHAKRVALVPIDI